jgi:Fe-S cluster biogenesis protein NfuA
MPVVNPLRHERHLLRVRRAAVIQVLDTVRPYLVKDGGNVKLVALDASAGKVALQFQGACSSCPSSQATLQLGYAWRTRRVCLKYFRRFDAPRQAWSLSM